MWVDRSKTRYRISVIFLSRTRTRTHMYSRVLAGVLTSSSASLAQGWHRLVCPIKTQSGQNNELVVVAKRINCVLMLSCSEPNDDLDDESTGVDTLRVLISPIVTYSPLTSYSQSHLSRVRTKKNRICVTSHLLMMVTCLDSMLLSKNDSVIMKMTYLIISNVSNTSIQLTTNTLSRNLFNTTTN